MIGTVVSLQMAAASTGKRLPYKRVLIEWLGAPGSRVQIVLAGLRLNGGARRPRHVVDHISSAKKTDILATARRAAELHGLDLIEDTIGIVNPDLGPVVYSLNCGRDASPPGAA